MQASDQTQLIVILDASEDGHTRRVTLEIRPDDSWCELRLTYGSPVRTTTLSRSEAGVALARNAMDDALIREASRAKARRDKALVDLPIASKTATERLIRLKGDELLSKTQQDLNHYEAMVQFWLDARPQLQQYCEA